MNDSSALPYQFYLINLDRSPDRLETCSKRFDELGLPFSRVPALDGETLLPELSGLDLSGYDFRHGKSVNPNELGCYLSHYKAIETFMASENEYGIIMEDDAWLSEETKTVLDALITHNKEWDVANLNGRHHGMPVRQKRLTETHSLVAYLFRRTGAACYLINREAGLKYLNKLLPMKVPYDHEFDRAWVYGFKYRGVQPIVAEGVSGQVSTIGYKKESTRGKKKPQWKRGSVLLYRMVNEVTRLGYHLVRGLFIPRN